MKRTTYYPPTIEPMESSSKRIKMTEAAVSSAMVNNSKAKRALTKRQARKPSYLLSRRVTSSVRSLIKQELNRNEETKYNDRTAEAASIDYDGRVIEIHQGIVPGDSNKGNRQGAKIQNKAVGIRIQCLNNLSSNRQLMEWRIIVARWHNENGTVPDTFNILTSLPTSLRWMLPYRFDDNKNWTILDDVRAVTHGYSTATAPPGTNDTSFEYDKVIPLTHKTTFNDTDNGIIDGGVYVFVLAQEDNAYGFRPAFRYSTRLYYTDD